LSPDYDELLASVQFDVCINAAGSSSVPYSTTHPISDFEANTLDTIRILDGIKRHQPTCRYLHISSAAVYGNPSESPTSEDSRLQPVSPYGWHKLMAEHLCAEYANLFNVKVAVVRPFSVFGVGLEKQLFWDLYTKSKVAKAGTLKLWGSGEETRDFIYIDDLVRALDVVVRHGSFNAHVYNIASGRETTIKYAAESLLKLLNPSIRPVFTQESRKGDPVNWRANISRIQNLGFQPLVPFESGIDKLAIWLKSLN
jgi:dTDP-glucose 4,6-dehydratase/UDP-glucose 4-epimerase